MRLPAETKLVNLWDVYAERVEQMVANVAVDALRLALIGPTHGRFVAAPLPACAVAPPGLRVVAALLLAFAVSLPYVRFVGQPFPGFFALPCVHAVAIFRPVFADRSDARVRVGLLHPFYSAWPLVRGLLHAFSQPHVLAVPPHLYLVAGPPPEFSRPLALIPRPRVRVVLALPPAFVAQYHVRVVEPLPAFAVACVEIANHVDLPQATRL